MKKGTTKFQAANIDHNDHNLSQLSNEMRIEEWEKE